VAMATVDSQAPAMVRDGTVAFLRLLHCEDFKRGRGVDFIDRPESHRPSSTAAWHLLASGRPWESMPVAW